MITLDSVKFDTFFNEWKSIAEKDGMRIWGNKYRDNLRQLLVLSRPNDLPEGYPDINIMTQYNESLADSAGMALVSLKIQTVKGVEYFQTIVKARIPENKLAMRYLGTFMIPTQTFFCGFQFQCDEQGTTGMREATVYAVRKSQGKIEDDKPKQEPKAFKTMDDFFGEIKASPVRRIPSDDEEYDAMFPEHPLSRLRAYLNHLERTIEFDTEVKNAKPFRTGGNNKGNWLRNLIGRS